MMKRKDGKRKLFLVASEGKALPDNIRDMLPTLVEEFEFTEATKALIQYIHSVQG